MTRHYSGTSGLGSGEFQAESKLEPILKRDFEQKVVWETSLCGNENSKTESGAKDRDPIAADPKHEQVVENLAPQTPMVWALRKLARASRFAEDCDRPGWDFAVEIEALESLGTSHDELRWMLGKGLVEHARESNSIEGEVRTFERSESFGFSSESCFVITITGLELASRLQHQYGEGFLRLPITQPDPQLELETPTWDDQRKELRFGGMLVKHFKWKAANQEAILAAFQEEGWPVRIDDPLSPLPDTDPKRRLSDTIKCLNRKQEVSLIRFTGDGTGEGVRWQVVPKEA